MKIKKLIEISVEKKGDNIICNDARAVALVIGTTAISGNERLYNITRNEKQGYWIVPIESIKARIKELKNRREKLNEYIDIMEQIIK